MHLLTIPPGGRGKAHLHANHETAIYILSGEAEMWVARTDPNEQESVILLPALDK